MTICAGTQYKPQDLEEMDQVTEGDCKSLEEVMVQLVKDHQKRGQEIVTKHA